MDTMTGSPDPVPHDKGKGTGIGAALPHGEQTDTPPEVEIIGY